MGCIRRVRVRVAGVVVVAAVVAAAGATVPGGGDGRYVTVSETRYATASVTSVRTSITGTSAAEMNARTSAITGLGDLFDVLRTVALPDGRWLSFTGDANAEAGQPVPVYDNAAVIWDAAGQRRVQPPGGGNFFPRWPDGSEFWPYQFVLSGGRAYVLGERVKSYEGAGNWTKLGGYGAVVDVPTGADPRFLAYFPTPGSLLDDTAVQWNGAIADGGDGWLYLHGVRERTDAYSSRDGGYVARVALSRLEVPHRWQVWTGQAWSDRVDQAVPTIPIWAGATDGTSSAYTLHRRPSGDWQVTTKRGGDISQTLGRYTGPSPWGPWTWEPLLQVCSLDCYLAGAAPSIPTASGRLLVQWSRSDSTPVWAEVPQ